MELISKTPVIKEGGLSSKLGPWWRYFRDFYLQGGFDSIYAKLKEESGKGKKILPDSRDTYRSFSSVDPDNLKAIFTLMEPYATVYNGVPAANGIAMDCSARQVLQPSLIKFYDAIADSELPEGIRDRMTRPPGLDYLCEQGVMFTNVALTVPLNQTGQHIGVWTNFIKYFHENVLEHFSGIIHILCGKTAQEGAKSYINTLSNYVFELEHPVYSHRQGRDWRYNNIFKSVNNILRENNGPDSEIEWIYDSYSLPF